MKRFMRRPSQRGYSLIEMMIVLPIMTITLVAIFMLVHENLRQLSRLNTESRLRINAESTLSSMRDDIQNVIFFLGMNPANNPDAHIPAGHAGPTYTDRWGAIQATGSPLTYTPRAFIFLEPAYTGPPGDPARQLIYRANTPNSCTEIANGTADGLNEFSTNTIIIFAKDNTIWKRTLTEDPATMCGTNYKQTSCAPTDTRGGSGDLCVADDVPLVRDVTLTNFPFQAVYYNYEGNEMSMAELYDTGFYGPFAKVNRVNLTLNLVKLTADDPITASANLDVRRTN